MAPTIVRNTIVLVACCLAATQGGAAEAQQWAVNRILAVSAPGYGPPIYPTGPPSYPMVPTASPPPAPAPSPPHLPPSYPPAYGAYPPYLPPTPLEPPFPPSNPCGDCQICLDKLRVVAGKALAKRNPWTTSGATARDFLDACFRLPAEYNAACSSVAAEISRGTSFISARPGMICRQLGACRASVSCPDLNATFANGTQLTGDVDLCTAEGVKGGINVTLPSAIRGVGSCRTRAECQVAGDVCFMGDSGPPPKECFCEQGRDICYNLGVCTPFCNLTSTIRQVTRLNADAASCTPGSETDKCPDGYRCVRMPDGYKQWECDRQIQSLVSKDCKGRCLPSVLKPTAARLTDSGDSVSLTLNTYAGRLYNAPCDLVFDASTVGLIGGPGAAQCSTYDNTLYVRLPATATIRPDQILTLRSSGSALVAQVDSTAAFSGDIKMLNCLYCARPNAVIFGPSAITEPCTGDDLVNAAGAVPPTFDASLSSHPSGRPAWVNVVWSLNETGGVKAGRDLLRAAINRTNAITDPNDRLQLKLTINESFGLPAADNYMVRLTLTSWLNTTSSFGFSFKKSGSDSPPAVKIIGPSRQDFLLSSGVRVGADSGQVCGGKAINWLWTSPDNWLGMATAGEASQQLFLPPPLLAAHGQNIKLRVSASFNGTNTSAYEVVTMVGVGSNPIAKLKGQAGKVPKNGSLIFNATSSRDPDSTPDLQQLSYKWDCSREDYPTPCFSGSDQGDMDSVPGVWILPTQLLEIGIRYTITVTVDKSVTPGASPLASSASLEFEVAVPASFPVGSLTRQCSPDQCAKPHNTADDLVVMLTIISTFSWGAKVSWRSEEMALENLSALKVGNATYLLTVPSLRIPTNLNEITITAVMEHNGYNGLAFLTVPVNAPPYCTLDSSNPAKCFRTVMVTRRYPQAVATISATGWSDYGDGTALTYEFGTVNGTSVNTQQLGGMTSATLLGLYYGSVSLYGCAVDKNGARTCATIVEVVDRPVNGFDARLTLSSVNLRNVKRSNSKSILFGAANQCGTIFRFLRNLLSFIFGHHRRLARMLLAADDTVSSQTIELVNGVMAGTKLEDIEQVKLALSSITNTATSASGLLTAEAANAVLSALDSLTSALAASSSASTVSTESATQVCSILAAALPSPLTADGSRQWLSNVLSSTSKVTAGLGKQATPGGGFLAAGDNGIYVAAAAVALSGDSFASATVRSGPSASTTAKTSRRSTLELLQLSQGMQQLQQEKQQEKQQQQQHQQQQQQVFRRLQQHLGGSLDTVIDPQEVDLPKDSESITSTRRAEAADPHTMSHSSRRSLQSTRSNAEAVLTLSSSDAVLASSFSIGLTQVVDSTAVDVVTSALGSGLPSGIVLASGLVDVTWSSTTSSSSQPPSLDGTNGYITLKLPVASTYNAAKLTACVQYDKSSHTVSGSLTGLTAAKSSVVFEGYNATSGLVSCRITSAGTYIVALGTPPPPPLAGLTAPPPASLPQSAPTSSIPGKKESHTGAIIGGVVGGVGGAIVVIAVIALLIHQRRRRQEVQASPGTGVAPTPSSWQGGQGPTPPAEKISVQPPGGGAAPAAAVNGVSDFRLPNAPAPPNNAGYMAPIVS